MKPTYILEKKIFTHAFLPLNFFSSPSSISVITQVTNKRIKLRSHSHTPHE